MNWAEIHQISVLGIDEIVLKRGHRDYVVIVTSKTSTGVSMLRGLARLSEKRWNSLSPAFPQAYKR
jgi:hypothetical protein